MSWPSGQLAFNFFSCSTGLISFLRSSFVQTNEKQLHVYLAALKLSLKNYLFKDASAPMLLSGLNGTWELPGFVISVKGTELAGLVRDKRGKASDPIWFI